MSKKRIKNKPFFSPDKIAFAIRQKLNRDLSSAEYEYGGMNPAQRFYIDAQGEATLKKYVSPQADMRGVARETFSAFLATNDRMREVNRNFRVPRDISNQHATTEEILLKRARLLMHKVLGRCWWSDLCAQVSHSGGVTSGVSYRDTSVEAKFTWPMSGTAKAASLFRQYLSESFALKDAIQKLNGHQPMAERYEEIEGSRATTVPKTNAKLRMIAIEPTLNMFFQQGLMRLMYKRMAKVGLDVESLPTRHQELAYRGSITGRNATIDFSNASDCVSLELLRYLLPPSWFSYVDLVRCPEMSISGDNTELEMVSTMGNAGTFPLETLVFWTIGVATVMQRTQRSRYQMFPLIGDLHSVSVFGDDCILPVSDAASFMENCERLGFEVNKEKSFYAPEYRFRESCGGDYYHGSNVRPFSLKAPTGCKKSALEPWLYTISNAILRRYEQFFGRTKYVYERELLAYLFDIFRFHKLKVKLVPAYFPDDSGLKTSDWERLRECYNIVLDKVAVSDQGLHSFRYCRFVYTEKQTRDEFLRYNLWLSKPTFSKRSKIIKEFPIRRKGGYVVARALSSCWS